MPRPSLKSTVPYYRGADELVFRRAGELIVLEDPDGQIARLAELLDGTRDEGEIFSELTTAYPDVTREELRCALADLDDCRLIQDADATRDGLSDEHCERWSRNLGFFETYASMAVSKYDFQNRIGATKVAMLGVGGVGTHALMDMVAIGFSDIRVVDYDVVELSNLNRQVLYGDRVLGQRKVRVAEEWVRGYNGDVRLEVVERRLGSADDVYELVADRDIVIAAIDRPKTKALRWLNEGCVRAGAVLVTGGIDTQRAMHFTVVPGISGCVECWRSSVERDDADSRELFDRLDEQDDAGVRFGEDMAAFNGLVGLHTAFQVGDLVRLATAVCPPLSVGRLLQVLFHNPVLAERESWTRRPDCPVCAGARAPERFQWLENASALDAPLQPAGGIGLAVAER